MPLAEGRRRLGFDACVCGLVSFLPFLKGQL